MQVNSKAFAVDRLIKEISLVCLSG